MKLKLSGAVKASIQHNHLYAEGNIECKQDDFQITIESSGSGNTIFMNNVVGGNVFIRGNGRIIIDGVEINANTQRSTSASWKKIDIDLKQKIKKIDCSGSSSLKVEDGSILHSTLSISCNGASNVSLFNHALDRVKVDLSGSSSCEGNDVTVDELDVDVSGASSCTGFHIGGDGDLDASGASTISATCNDKRRVRQSTSGVSQINVRELMSKKPKVLTIEPRSPPPSYPQIEKKYVLTEEKKI